MINRRIIRTKVLQSLFSYNSQAIDTIDELDKDLKFTFSRIYDLYFFLLLFLIELNEYATERMEKAKNKFLPSEEDLSPSTKFIKNKIIVQLKENKHLQTYLNQRNFTWKKDNDILKDIYDIFIETDEYKNYIISDDNSYAADKNILLFLIQTIMYNSPSLYSALEEESIYWIDNVDTVLLAIVITLERYSIGDDMGKKLLKKFKNKDDEDFAYKLLHLPVLKNDVYTEIIKNNVINWDFERISRIDKIILTMAICELIDFPEIPIKVSLNEYIELSKVYGIPKKSPNFVNGLLDKIVGDLNAKKIIAKKGRGLKEK
ncbi:MAG: transcription antitermination protein NusB [Bacteroidales bacterium]|nr:transcription antitermination protein NusB [Bacteroidales bacterium]